MSISQKIFDFYAAYAKYFCERFAELFERELTEIERSMLESSVLCISGMMAESISNHLHHTKSLDKAMENFNFLESQKQKYFDEIKTKLLEEAEKQNIEIINKTNLLSIQREILEKL